MNRKHILALAAIAALGLCGVVFYLYGGHSVPARQPPLADLNPNNFTDIENAFNAAPEDVRVLLLLSPT